MKTTLIFFFSIYYISTAYTQMQFSSASSDFMVLQTNMDFSDIGATEDDINLLICNINEITLQQKVSQNELVKEFMNISQKGLNGTADDVKLYLEVKESDAEIEALIKKQKEDGSWPDINYSDKNRSNWNPKLHAIRFQVMAKAYKTTGNAFYGSPRLSRSLHKAMNFWFNAKLICSNWWYNEIGIPMWMAPGFLLILDEMSQDEINGAITILKKRVKNATGQNKVWDAGNAVFLGLISRNLNLVKSYRDSIVSEIFITTREGLQSDYSFHQHGPQMQFGNYGLAYFSIMAYWARALRGTRFGLDSKQIDCLSKYVIEGLQWPIWRGYMDFSACGRQVFKDAQRSKSHTVAVSIQNFLKTDTMVKEKFNRFILENLLDINRPNSLCGHKHFWRSDFTVHRTPEWYASVRMNSSRTIGVEMTNNENLQGFYAADGVMSLMYNGTEYLNIFPVWNWRRLPGLTVQDSVTATIVKKSYGVDFAGGVSNGTNGISAMIVKHDGLTAFKSYFFLGNTIICMGAGISSEKCYPVYTTLNQEWLKGEIKYIIKGKKYKTLTNECELVNKQISAVYHNQTGYFIKNPGDVYLSNKTQGGNWNRIAEFYKSEPSSGKIFLLSINHGNTRSDSIYEYCLMPGITQGEFSKFLNKPSYKTMSNNRYCMAIANNEEQTLLASFFMAGSVALNRIKISSLNSGLLMIDKLTDGKITITVSDPMQQLTEFKLEISGKYSGTGTVYIDSQEVTLITIPLPTSQGFKGSCVSVEIKPINN